MAATFRSHFRHPPPNESTTSQSERKRLSRVPAKSTENARSSTQVPSAQQASLLGRRTSRSVRDLSSDKKGTGATTVEKAPSAGSSARQPSASSRRAAVPQQSGTIPTTQPEMSRSKPANVLPPPPTMRTPSHVSGPSLSTADKPTSKGLRRKPSTIETYAATKKSESRAVIPDNATAYSRDESMSAAFEDSILGISIPQTGSDAHHGSYFTANPRYRLLSDMGPGGQPVTRDITPPVPNYAPSSTPSTRYTDSPFSHVPTPSSASSYSSVMLTSTNTPRLRQQSPTCSGTPAGRRSNERNDVGRLALPVVRESSTSSSNSTVKPNERTATIPKEVPRKPATAPPGGKTPGSERSSSRGKLVKEKPRQGSASSSAKPTTRIPPELAHLNVEPSPVNLNKALPPIRPSREGTPMLEGMTNPSPVVQSDLPKLYNTYHKRTPSQETNNPASPLKSRFGLSPRSPSRQESPRIDSALSPPPVARSLSRGPTPAPKPAEGHKLTRKDSPAVGPAPSPSKSPRFGFWSRKPKPEAAKPTEKPKRQPVKGPVAGTGHEGYRKFGVRGRSGSTTSSTGMRSSSTDSNTSSQPRRVSQGRKSSVTSKDGSDMDDFLRERLSPVVLRGSGSTVSNAASRSESQPPTAPTSKTSSLENYTKPQLLPSATIQGSGKSPAKRQQHPTARAPSDSSQDDVFARYPTLAARRSLTRLSQGDKDPRVRLPAPIDTSRPSKDSSLDSYDAEGSAHPLSDSTLPTDDLGEGNEGLWLRPLQKEPERAEQEPRPSRKWNFFQRAQASPRRKGKEKAPAEPQYPTIDDYQSPQRGNALSTMFDPVEPVALEEVERIMEESETSFEDSASELNVPSRTVPYERRHESLLPSPHRSKEPEDARWKGHPHLPAVTVRQAPFEFSEKPHIEPPSMQQHDLFADEQWGRAPMDVLEDHTRLRQSPRQMHTPEILHSSLNTPDLQDDSPARQPRLSPVGRIPKVVSKRDRDRKLADSSFSRPFGRAQPKPTVQPPGSLYSQIRELASPVEPVSSTSTNSNRISSEHKSSLNTNAPSTSTNRTSMDVHGNEFFTFPPRKDSDLSYSGSSGNNSWMASMAAPPPQMEDVWAEYNDLLDDVMPPRTPLSAGSSLGAPFQYSSTLYEPANAHSQQAPSHIPWSQLPLPPLPNANPTVLTLPQQIARLQPSMSPLSTPNQLADFVDHYGNRSTSTLYTPTQTIVPEQRRPSLARSSRSSIPGPNRNSAGPGNRTSVPSARGSMASSRQSRGSAHSRSASLPEANGRNSQSSLAPSVRFNRDTQLLDIAEVEGDDHAAAANLRFGALMTSKWLSFGRVLFSPADNEMRLADDPKVLIVDGLGSDWSFYVALQYPAAAVYNLGPAPPNGSAWPGVNQRPPPNHRHINLDAISGAFPFPKGFFTAVVFRFPLATTDEAYHSAIFECKRVLRPGGYLEVAVLDLDLMNMGSRARKAVRGLKTRMQEKDQHVSLRNLSDTLVRLIGRRGFEDVQRCIVGVPAAGRIPRSQDMSSSSSGRSSKPVWQREDRVGKEFSFADLLEDARSSQIEARKDNDESITKMVAKVGRWWYSSCYEKALFPSDTTSIWNDHTLLRECEKQGTSFRLLICHAQKPTQTRRRTVSV
ncbi:uncharacterized protein LTR77_003694 [Saxophila tyrrhenica]|uniref:Methyltransferase type 11 domain-containing protein n=1 Tax=Saxophila tyrrhenica TaxID=1690608 RepID=A0AAV9PFU0_9PEZI|nr:hypothetical protein LTR77_003694 [Saxophila tyrrhenica]